MTEERKLTESTGWFDPDPRQPPATSTTSTLVLGELQELGEGRPPVDYITCHIRPCRTIIAINPRPTSSSMPAYCPRCGEPTGLPT